MKKQILLALITLIFISCSNEMDRTEAEKLINEFYEYPNIEFVKIDISLWKNEISPKLKELQNQGYISIDRDASLGMGGAFRVNFIGEGKGFWHQEFDGHNTWAVTNERKIKEITGIRTENDGKKAIVDFKIERINKTPFFILSNYSDTQDYSVNMELFDDGWRITNEKVKNFNRKDYPGFK